MNICDLKKGERAVVIKVECVGELRDRLISLGLFCGAKITLLKVSPLKHSYLVSVGSGKVALAKVIADKVRIWKI